MVKKARRMAYTEASTSTAYHQVLEDDKAQFRFRYLFQDYEELQMETEAKKQNLQKAKQKKLKLLAEVKFLREKYQTLLANPPQTTLRRLKKQSQKMPVPSAGTGTPTTSLQVSTEKNHTVIGAAKPKTCTLLDLNQVSLPFGDDAKELETHMEPLRPMLLKRRSMNGGPKDQKPPVCRDVGSNSNRVDRRKITWQDQVVLRV